jgi:hypothetical protein
MISTTHGQETTTNLDKNGHKMYMIYSIINKLFNVFLINKYILN